MNLLDSIMGPSKILVFLLIFIDLALWSQDAKFSKALFELEKSLGKRSLSHFNQKV